MNCKGYADLANLPENQRCRVIADTATQTGGKIGFVVDNDEKIIERYIRKIKERAPNLTIERIGQLTAGSFALSAQLKNNN